MIPRYQKVLLWLLLVSSVLMAAWLIRMRARAQEQIAAVPDAAPMPVPVEAPAADITLMIANDADGSLTPVERQLALPAEPTTRARALLNDLFAEYAHSDSPHPLAQIPAVNNVFLLPLPAAVQNAAPSPAGQLAIVNLSDAFVDRHPSGILVETLTLLSLLGTLHANLPQIAEVRFTVGGMPRETLAGHVDLMRTYLTREGEIRPGADPAAPPAEHTP